MIDISSKDIVKREALASGKIRLKKETLDAIIRNDVKKGNVIETARIAGTMAVKNTALTVPYCHSIPISGIDLDFNILNDGIEAICTVKAIYRTGVEMEAIHGVMVSLLTIWDMVKYLEKDENGQYPETMVNDIKVIYKVKS